MLLSIDCPWRHLDVFTPTLHHRASTLDEVSVIIGATHLILINVRECYFDQLSIPAMLVQYSARHRPHAMTDQASCEPHPFEYHIGDLVVAMSSEISICGKYIFMMPTDRFDSL